MLFTINSPRPPNIIYNTTLWTSSSSYICFFSKDKGPVGVSHDPGFLNVAITTKSTASTLTEAESPRASYWFANALHRLLWIKDLMICSALFILVLCRRGISQLSPHVPLWLRDERVRLQVEPHHLLHRRHVLPGPGHGPQEGVPRAGGGPITAHRGRKPPKWLRSMDRGQLGGGKTIKDEASQSSDSSTFLIHWR